jgi:hypothetical protein
MMLEIIDLLYDRQGVTRYMRSGSPAHDGGGWPSAQRPHPDEATSSPARFGPPGGDPHDGPGGRREAPFGPEISWPYGFRQMDPESRDLLESAYRPAPGYQQPAVDDYGYGDPGYSDPSYEGPKTPYNGPAFPGQGGGAPDSPSPRPFSGSGYRLPGPVPGYHAPEIRDSSRPGGPGRSYPPPAEQDIWPVTGAQEALPDTGPQPAAGGIARAGSAAYPEQWYGHPRLDDRVTGDARRGAADPRLKGINYGELRYDDPEPGKPVAGGPAGGGSPRRPEPQGPGFGQRPGSGIAAAPSRPAGYGQPGGYGQPRGPQPSAAPKAGPAAGQPGSSAAAKGTGFLAAPVGLLTPPDGIRVAALRTDDADPGVTVGVLTAPDTGRRGRPGPVRPGHGLDGPEITSSWPAQPAPGNLDSFDDFWRDDEDEEYTGLFGDRGAEFDRADAKQAARQASTRPAAAKRGTGRRRGRSNDHRLWLALGGVIVVAAAAIVAIIKFEFPSHSGPVHTMSIPATIGDYTRTVNLERTTDVAQLRDEVIKMSSGQASDVKSAVYKSGNSAAGNTEQIIMFIGGHLANADPAASIASFTQKFPGARVAGPGSLGGEAACVQEGGAANAVAMCAWFDNDSFGEIVSPTMNATALAKAMQTVRPAVEQVAQK